MTDIQTQKSDIETRHEHERERERQSQAESDRERQESSCLNVSKFVSLSEILE